MAEVDRLCQASGRVNVGGVGGGERSVAGEIRPTVAVPSSSDRSRHHHLHHHQQQQQPGIVNNSYSSSTFLRTLDRVSLTEPVWNLGHSTRDAAVRVLRHSPDGVSTGRLYIVRSGTDLISLIIIVFIIIFLFSCYWGDLFKKPNASSFQI